MRKGMPARWCEGATLFCRRPATVGGGFKPVKMGSAATATSDWRKEGNQPRMKLTGAFSERRTWVKKK